MRVGYACISLPLREQDIFSSRTLTLASLEKKGIEEAKRLAMDNIRDLGKIIEYNESVGIRFFRITSNLVPHLENPRADLSAEYSSIEFAKPELARIGRRARELGHRLTMHPGQYAQLGSPRPEVVKQTYRDLSAHARVFLALGMTPSLGSVMIIHGGGTFGDKLATIERFKIAFRALDPEISQYIALENDEFQYSVMDLLPLCEELSIPLCIDFFHHQVMYSQQFNIFEPELLRRVLATWKLRGIKPKCHWSKQRPGARPGTHDDCVDDIPATILNWCKREQVDIMLEVKHKDECALRILEAQFTKIQNGSRVEWFPK